jgi:signal peptidase II
MKKSRHILILSGVVILLVAIDQITKYWARAYLMDQPPQSYLWGCLRLEYAENVGAFLSFGSDWSKPLRNLVFIILPLVFLGGLWVYTLFQAGKHKLLYLFPFALVISGGAGNLVDRILFDLHVSDFMVFGIGSLHTGILNVADMYVTGGVIMLLIYYKKIQPPEPSNPSGEEKAES